MSAREFKGQLPPKSCIQSRFCSFLEYTEVPGGIQVEKAYRMFYLLADGRVVVDPFSRDGMNLPAVFPSMPEGVEILTTEG